MQSRLKEIVKQGENSPFYKLLSMKIEDVRKDSARLSIEIDRKHIQFLGTVHGGVVATLADSAAAWAIYGSDDLEGHPVTVEMKINFLKPVKSGKIIAKARIIHCGSRIFVSDVDVKDGGGDSIARSLVTYYLLKR